MSEKYKQRIQAREKEKAAQEVPMNLLEEEDSVVNDSDSSTDIKNEDPAVRFGAVTTKIVNRRHIPGSNDICVPTYGEHVVCGVRKDIVEVTRWPEATTNSLFFNR